MGTLTTERILEALGGVVEPVLGKDLVSLDLVEVLSVEGEEDTWKVRIRVKSSSPAMHARQRMREAVEFAMEKLSAQDGQSIAVDVEDVPLGSNERTLETRKVLPGVRHVIAVASGKGGVGKSTVTAMTGGILRGAGIAGGTGGNLDTPFCDLLEHDTEDAVHAVELSSFQLETWQDSY